MEAKDRGGGGSGVLGLQQGFSAAVWHLGPEASLLSWGCAVHCGVLGSIPGLHSPGARSTPAPTCLFTAQCALEGTVTLPRTTEIEGKRGES